MTETKFKQIQEFCTKNADAAIVKKYSRYFKDGYKGYGIDHKIFEAQKNKWLEEWKNDMNIDKYLDLGDTLIRSGKFEEISFAIHFIAAQREQFTIDTFDRVGNWFEMGISNWGSTDVLCMLVLMNMLRDEIIDVNKLKEWNKSPSEWKRRAVPVTLSQMVRIMYDPELIFPTIEPLMLDESEYVQKGLGTLLRELWKKYKQRTESFLLEWKDNCGRLIIRYATEKMSKEEKVRFRKSK